METETPRYTVTMSGGSRPGRPYAVLDTQDRQGGKGMRRVSFHRTPDQAKRAARKLNEADR